MGRRDASALTTPCFGWRINRRRLEYQLCAAQEGNDASNQGEAPEDHPVGNNTLVDDNVAAASKQIEEQETASATVEYVLSYDCNGNEQYIGNYGNDHSVKESKLEDSSVHYTSRSDEGDT